MDPRHDKIIRALLAGHAAKLNGRVSEELDNSYKELLTNLDKHLQVHADYRSGALSIVDYLKTPRSAVTIQGYLQKTEAPLSEKILRDAGETIEFAKQQKIVVEKHQDQPTAGVIYKIVLGDLPGKSHTPPPPPRTVGPFPATAFDFAGNQHTTPPPPDGTSAAFPDDSHTPPPKEREKEG